MKEFLLLLGLATLLLAFSFLMVGIKIFFHKSKKFPETSAGHNRELRKRGIGCPRHEEIKCWIPRDEKSGCATCFEGARD